MTKYIKKSILWIHNNYDFLGELSAMLLAYIVMSLIYSLDSGTWWFGFVVIGALIIGSMLIAGILCGLIALVSIICGYLDLLYKKLIQWANNE